MTGLEPAGTVHVKFSLLLVFAVLAAFGPIMLVNQPWWDDWVLRAYSQLGTLFELYRQVGARELFLLVKPFAAAPPALCGAFELLLYALIAPMIYAIIRRATRWSAVDAFWAALLTALLPLNQARFSLSTLPYAFTSFFFTLSVLLLLRDLDRPSVIGRVAVAASLLVAFTTNSFLVLAWLMPLIVAIEAVRRAPSSSPREQAFHALRAVVRRGELLLLPPAYWLAKKLLEPTYGLYADYNTFQMSLPAAIKQTVLTLFTQFGDAHILLPPAYAVPQLLIAAAIVVGMFVVTVAGWKLPLLAAGEPPSLKRRAGNAAAIATGLALAVCALFPYVIVGKPPRYNGLWETRHQTTLLLVGGFLFYAVLRAFLQRRALVAVTATLCAVFLILNIWATQWLLLDALETRQIAAEFEAKPPVPGTMLLVMEDDRAYRALGRYFPFYELSYIVNPKERPAKLFAVSNHEMLEPSTGTYVTGPSEAARSKMIEMCDKYRATPVYGFGDFVANGAVETVRLLPNPRPPGLLQTIRTSAETFLGDDKAAYPAPLVSLERTPSQLGRSCQSPCCSGD